MIKNLLSKRIIKSSLLGIIMAVVFVVSFALASIPLGSNFQLNSQLPLDARTVVVDIAARDAIPSGQRYRGLTVYVLSDATNYQLQAGITNGDWIALADAGGSMIYPGAGIAVSNGASWGPSIVNNSANWNTAFGWGNHAVVGYVTGTPWTGMGYITDGNTGWDNSYGFITSLNGAVLTDQTTPQTVGNTTDRLSKLWVTDIDVEGSIVLPTTVDATSGVIYKGVDSFIHNFALPGTDGDNTFIGINAGNFTMTGSVGLQGSANVGIGTNVLSSNTTGIVNTGIGVNALRYNTTGSANTGLGERALNLNTTGEQNTAGGYASLSFNTTGVDNTAFGFTALNENTTGNYNTATGMESLDASITGDYNTANGYRALVLNTTGSNNTAIGAQSFYDLDITTDDGSGNNTAIGFNTGRGIVTGLNNTILGANVIGLPSDLSNTVIIANGAGAIFAHNFGLPGTDGFNTFVGIGSGNFTMTGSVGIEGSRNTAVGYESLPVNTKGNLNTAMGYRALYSNTEGWENTATGYRSLESNVDGVANVAIGYKALLSNITTQANTAIGHSALTNATANDNTAIGYAALFNTTTGGSNTAMGVSALDQNTTGSGNVALGTGAGKNLIVPLLTNLRSTFIGSDANSSVDGVDNSMALGYQAQVTQSNQVVIGNTSVTETLLRGNVGIGTTSPGELLSLGSVGTRGMLSLSGDISGKIIIQPADNAGNYTLTLPTALGTAGQVLTDIAGDGVLGWTSGGGGGFTDPMTTAGDIIIRNALNVTTRLGAGNAGQVLTSDGTNISWEDPAGVSGAQTPWLSDINAAGYTLFGNNTDGGNLTLDSTSSGIKGNVLINPTGGNVGIGITAPEARLHLYKDVGNVDDIYGADLILSRYWVSNTDTRAASIYNYYNNTTVNDQLVFGVTGDGGAVTNPSLYSNAKMVIQANGNVGIGTTTPTQILDVLGNININANSAYMYDGTNVITALPSSDNYFFANSGNLAMTGFSNLAMGGAALLNNTLGEWNIAYGPSALLNNTTGSRNISFGLESLDQNTTGSGNIAMGVYALYDLNIEADDGSGNNTAIGSDTGRGIITGVNNTIIGANVTGLPADLSNTVILANGAGTVFTHNFALPGTDGGNTFAGLNAGNFTMTGSVGAQGSYNTGLGQSSLQSNTTGGTNSAIGFESLRDNSTGNNNTANGMQALSLNTTGSNNTAIGAQALYDLNGSGNNNTAIGFDSGRGIVTGINNTIIGANVGGLDPALSDNIIIADGAGNRRINVDSAGNVGIGTTTPDRPLQVVGIVESATTSGSLRRNVIIQATDSFGFLDSYNFEDGIGLQLLIQPNGGNTILSTSTTGFPTFGNVGIGTIDPQKKLEINDGDTNTTTSGLRFTDFACTGDDKLTVGAGGDVICATDQTGSGTGNIVDTLTDTLGAGNDANALDITNIGRLYAVLGTEGSPTFSFQADTDTGMWSSATNILNFSTDATERMRIDNLGNVGIGTNAPSSLLSVHYGVDTGDTTLPSGTWASQILNINDATGEGALVVANRWANVDTQIFSVGNMCDGCGNAGFDTFFSVFGDGKVGIGTTTPGAELDVNGTIESNGLSISYAGTSANIYSYNNSAYPGIHAESQSGAGVEGYTSGTFGFGVYGNAGNSAGTGVYGQSKNGHGVYGFINGSLGGATNSAGYFEAVSTGYGLIVASGDVGIGNTAPATALDVTGTIRQSNCTTAGTLSANTSGDIICTPSSQEFKDNISDLTTGLSDILALRPVSYTFRPEMSMGSGTRFGFISEEVSALVPEFATHDAEGNPYGLDNGAILAASINAIKELNLNLEGIAGINTPLEDSENEFFVTTFFDNIKTTINTWLADATNGIGNMFADVFNAKEKICIDGECLTKDDVRALLLLVHPDGSSSTEEEELVEENPLPEEEPSVDPVPVDEAPVEDEAPIEEDSTVEEEEAVTEGAPVDEAPDEEDPAPTEEDGATLENPTP